jgi:hypothetical protein
MDMINVMVKREHRAFDVKIECTRKAFGEKFLGYLGPKSYNSMPISIKKEIYYTEGNRTTTKIKKEILSWLFSVL